jgi:hypothetical protein
MNEVCLTSAARGWSCSHPVGPTPFFSLKKNTALRQRRVAWAFLATGETVEIGSSQNHSVVGPNAWELPPVTMGITRKVGWSPGTFIIYHSELSAGPVGSVGTCVSALHRVLPTYLLPDIRSMGEFLRWSTVHKKTWNRFQSPQFSPKFKVNDVMIKISSIGCHWKLG